jgi:D-alanine-D-alanine ligase
MDDSYCPREHLVPRDDPQATMLTVLDMNLADARRWHAMLYHELRTRRDPMRVALTFDLRQDYLALGWSEEDAAEFDRPDTIDHLERSLRDLGHEVDRVGGAHRLVERLAAGDRWDLVFNIAEGHGGVGREALVPALLEAYGIPCTFSDPLVCALTLDKAATKRVLRDLGLPTPDFAVVETSADAERVGLKLPLFVKPLREGSSKGIDERSIVRSRAALVATCRRLIQRFGQPALVEELLPGREFTVAILGTGERARVIGVLDVSLRPGADAEVYSLKNKELCEELVDYRLAHDRESRDAAGLALRAYRGLGCRDAGRVDLRTGPDGRLGILEVNPLPGLHPAHSDLPIAATQAGLGYGQIIAAIVESALERTGRPADPVPAAVAQTCAS